MSSSWYQRRTFCLNNWRDYFRGLSITRGGMGSVRVRVPKFVFYAGDKKIKKRNTLVWWNCVAISRACYSTFCLYFWNYFRFSYAVNSFARIEKISGIDTIERFGVITVRYSCSGHRFSNLSRIQKPFECFRRPSANKIQEFSRVKAPFSRVCVIIDTYGGKFLDKHNVCEDQRKKTHISVRWAMYFVLNKMRSQS